MKVYYKVFKDNSGALELARTLKLWLRNKHMNVVYHNFWSYVRDKYFGILNQYVQWNAYIITKSLP